MLNLRYNGIIILIIVITIFSIIFIVVVIVTVIILLHHTRGGIYCDLESTKLSKVQRILFIFGFLSRPSDPLSYPKLGIYNPDVPSFHSLLYTLSRYPTS